MFLPFLFIQNSVHRITTCIPAVRYKFLLPVLLLLSTISGLASPETTSHRLPTTKSDFFFQTACSVGELVVSGVTAFRAEFSYKAKCSEVIEHGVCFSEEPNPVRGRSQKAAFYKGYPIGISVETKFKVDAENLYPETKYFARAYVKNLDGEIFYSKEINFSTTASDSLLFPKRQEIEGIKQEYYKNGQLMRSFTIKDGQVDGHSRFYSDSGQLISDQMYRNGKMEGPLTTYYPNGQMQSMTNFSDNMIQGPAKEFYKNGNLKKESNFTGEPFKFTGESKTYFEDGRIETEASFSNGQLSKAIHYDQQGRVTLEESPGNNISYSYDQDGWKHTHINGDKCQCARCND